MANHETVDKAKGAQPKQGQKRRRKVLRWLPVLLLLLLVAAVATFKIWEWAVVPRNAPVIGVSWDTAWHGQAGLSTKTYEFALVRVRAHVFDIEPGKESATQILDRIDALLVAGGGDIDPKIFGGKPGGAKLVDRSRDDLDLALIRGALERDMPILGICRGIQVLNVAHGGTIRNLRDEPALHKIHAITPRSLSAHTVEITTGTRMARIAGAGTKQVNSFHAQAVGRVGKGLQVAARSPKGIIEALERNDRRFVIGMQWHPEILSVVDAEDLAVFQVFVREAKRHRARKADDEKRTTDN